MKTITVKDIMTEHPSMVKPTQSVKEAARRMKEIDCGVLPIGTPESVVGIITDRDITLRVTAEGKDPAKTQVQDVMTKQVHTCNEDDDIKKAAEKMRKHEVARLVVTKGKQATGIVTMTCLLRNKDDRHASDDVLHQLLGPRKRPGIQQKAMAMAGTGSECCA